MRTNKIYHRILLVCNGDLTSDPNFLFFILEKVIRNSCAWMNSRSYVHVLYKVQTQTLDNLNRTKLYGSIDLFILFWWHSSLYWNWCSTSYFCCVYERMLGKKIEIKRLHHPCCFVYNVWDQQSIFILLRFIFLLR